MIGEEEWLVLKDIRSQPLGLLEEEWMVSRELCPQIFSLKDTSRPSPSEIS